nr:MAG TPA: hypothetical protein [Caudoviricetes sp.]
MSVGNNGNAIMAVLFLLHTGWLTKRSCKK